MTTGRTLKTGDVIKSLNLVEIRRQQRRVTTLLNGNPKDVPLLSYRQADAPSYRGKNLGTRRWPPGAGFHQKACQTDQNENEQFWDHFDNPLTKREQMKTTKDYGSHPLNNSPTEELTSSTPLPPIDLHSGNCACCQSPGGARKKQERRRQMSPATERSIPINSHVTRNRKSSTKPRNKPSQPVVKYQHQKLEPSTEERYRKYRQVKIEGVKKFTSCSTPEVWLRSDSGLSSASGISALRRRHVQFHSDDDDNNNSQRTSRPKSSSSADGWGTSDLDQLPLGLENLRGTVDDRTPGLRSMDKYNPNEENFSPLLLAVEDSGRCHPTPVADGSARLEEAFVRLPDIQIYDSNRPVLLPETRRFNPGIGETSRAFVFSYFDHLPPVSGSRDGDNVGSDGENRSQPINVLQTKTLIRKK